MQEDLSWHTNKDPSNLNNFQGKKKHQAENKSSNFETGEKKWDISILEIF